MSANAEAFDRWIRSSFVEMNTELENLYFAQPDRASVLGIGDRIKHLLHDEGHIHVSLNVGFDALPWENTVRMLAHFRSWVRQHPDRYALIDTKYISQHQH
jgi:hypothetical protein